MKDLDIFCADVGSITKGNFGWAACLANRREKTGRQIDDFAQTIARTILAGRRAAVGFECPLFVPLKKNPEDLGRARNNEGSRPWSAGAGVAVLGTGLVQTWWVLSRVRQALDKEAKKLPTAYLDWPRFMDQEPGLLLWEAFVSDAGKAHDHPSDAQLAARELRASLPNPASAIDEKPVLSLAGMALLRSGWSKDLSLLNRQCLVVKVSESERIRLASGSSIQER